MDCKPTAVDISESESDLKAVDLDEQYEYFNGTNKNNMESMTEFTSTVDSSQQELECKKEYPLIFSLKSYHKKYGTTKKKRDQMNATVQIDGKRRFKCPLCDKT